MLARLEWIGFVHAYANPRAGIILHFWTPEAAIAVRVIVDSWWRVLRVV